MSQTAGAEPAPEPSSEEPRGSFAHRLYTGTGGFDIVGKRTRYYVVFGVLILICALSMVFRGFTFGIDFTGGTEISMPAQSASGTISTQEVRSTFRDALGFQPDSVQSVGTGPSASIQIQTQHLSNTQTNKVQNTLFRELQPESPQGNASRTAISQSEVSGTWGAQITRRAIIGLIVFIVLLSAFLVLYFERWMAAAAVAGLFNDLIITAGVYSLTGFEVTPATVVGFLTILGFTLYDTVVVFDKVKEHTRGLLKKTGQNTGRTYPEAANLALNQTIMRSVNTSLIALLPVLGLLVVGAGFLGVGTLKDLALVQLVGLMIGTASSIFLATPLLVMFKTREKRVQDHDAKVLRKRTERARREAPDAADDSDTPEVAGGVAAATSVPGERALAGAGAGESRQRPQGSGPPPGRRPAGKGNRPSGKKRR
jgi:preprotein translocase subunit SecF